MNNEANADADDRDVEAQSENDENEITPENQNPVNEDPESEHFLSLDESTDYNSVREDSEDGALNTAFTTSQVSDSSSFLSVRTMTLSERETLERGFDTSSSTIDSLAWDNSQSLTALTDPLNDTRLYTPTDESFQYIDSDDDDVFANEQFASTPTFMRITRSTVRSGEYANLTISPIIPPFQRNNRLRRPRVRWSANEPEISDRGAAITSQGRSGRTSRH